MLALTLFVILFSVSAGAFEGRKLRERKMQHLFALPEDPAPEGGLVTHLPIIRIDTAGEPIPWVGHAGDPRDGLPAGTRLDPDCAIELLYKEGAWNTDADDPAISAVGTIRMRGNSSRNFDKKSYLLRFTDESGDNRRQALLGMAAGSEWVLYGPFLDRTLLRNYICYTVAGEVMSYAPNVRYCELILNGNYLGLYLLTEAVTKEAGRIDLTVSKNKNSPVTSWIIRWDREGKGNMVLDTFTHYTFKSGVSSIDLRYPGKDTVTEDKARYVLEEISSIERELYNTGFSDALDMVEFARYFVLNEFFGNVDAGRFSTFYYKDIRGKVKPVVWDFNNACDNYIDYEYAEDGFYLADAPWFIVMLQDKDFVEMVISEYRRLRKTLLSDMSLETMIDGTVGFLGDAVERNYTVWGYVFLAGDEEAEAAFDYLLPLERHPHSSNYLAPVERNYHSYEESVEQLKSWLVDRGRWLDKNIETLHQYCHPSKYTGYAK